MWKFHTPVLHYWGIKCEIPDTKNEVLSFVTHVSLRIFLFAFLYEGCKPH